jgi:hypothetical protein
MKLRRAGRPSRLRGFLACVGSLVLTFLARAEIDPVSLRGHRSTAGQPEPSVRQTPGVVPAGDEKPKP